MALSRDQTNPAHRSKEITVSQTMSLVGRPVSVFSFYVSQVDATANRKRNIEPTSAICSPQDPVSCWPLSYQVCWFLDAGNDETLGRLSWPASKKRQGTKSREVGRRRCSELRDLAAPKILCDRLVA